MEKSPKGLDRGLWRPVIFSRTTAQVTIPSAIRDKAKLVDVHNEGLGLYYSYNEANNEITMKVGIKEPIKKVTLPKKKTKK